MAGVPVVVVVVIEVGAFEVGAVGLEEVWLMT
jgi:hypothetical protein